MEWKKIESAPKDGSFVVGLEDDVPCIIRWEVGHISDGYWEDDNYHARHYITHWMPLPEPPKEEVK